MGKTIRNKIAGLLAAVSTCGFLMNGVSKVSARDFLDFTLNESMINGVNSSDQIKEGKVFETSPEQISSLINGVIETYGKDVNCGFVPVNYDSKNYNVLVVNKNVNQIWILLTVGESVPLFTSDIKESFINKWNELEKNQVVANPEKKEENKNDDPNNLNNDGKNEKKKEENKPAANLENKVNNGNNGKQWGLWTKVGISSFIVTPPALALGYLFLNGSSSSTDGGSIGVLDVYDF